MKNWEETQFGRQESIFPLLSPLKCSILFDIVRGIDQGVGEYGRSPRERQNQVDTWSIRTSYISDGGHGIIDRLCEEK